MAQFCIIAPSDILKQSLVRLSFSISLMLPQLCRKYSSSAAAALHSCVTLHPLTMAMEAPHAASQASESRPTASGVQQLQAQLHMRVAMRVSSSRSASVLSRPLPSPRRGSGSVATAAAASSAASGASAPSLCGRTRHQLHAQYITHHVQFHKASATSSTCAQGISIVGHFWRNLHSEC